MSQTAEYFDKNGYVVLEGAISKEQCDYYVSKMFQLHEEGKTTQDRQCPLSDSVYGEPDFEQLLKDFAEPIGNAIGKRLLPTYTYARIYRTGEVLKKHIDRPSCEISATLTLGYDAKNIWPIFFDEKREIPVIMSPGELTVYRGCDIVHWRPEFRGNWHVQLFLHYVDADGPHKDYVFDKRPGLGIKPDNLKDSNACSPDIIPVVKEHKQNQNQKLNPNNVRIPIFNGVMISGEDEDCPGYSCIDNSFYPELKFTKNECEKIISFTQENYPVNAGVGSGVIERKMRSAEIYDISLNNDTQWIFKKIAHAVSFMNKNYYDFELSGIKHSLQLIKYSKDSEVPGHYDWHTDTGVNESATRKLSFTAQLSDPNDYDGCELVINNHATLVTASKEQGSIHMFPSYMLHRVTPISRGDRYALVIWIHGYKRFR